jgi:hypothetical protein
MLVNANCPYSQRDTVQTLSPIYRERSKKTRILLYCTGASHSPASNTVKGEGFLFPTGHSGDVDSIQFLLIQEGIKTNLGQKGVKILFPFYSVQDIFPKNKLRIITLKKETSRTEQLSTRGGEE